MRGPARAVDLRALGGLVAVYPLGLSEAAWAQRTGYARKGGAWQERRRRYLTAGLIEQRDGRWFATAAGVERAGGEIPKMPPPGLELVRFWIGRLGTGPGRILKLLADVHPKALTRDAIAAELRLAKGGGAFSTSISALKTAELVTETGKRLAIAPGLMEEVR